MAAATVILSSFQNWLTASFKAPSTAGFSQQYVITNAGANLAFITAASTVAQATSTCVVPVAGGPTETLPVLPLSQVSVTYSANAWFCGITTGGTSVIYVTPGVGE